MKRGILIGVVVGFLSAVALPFAFAQVAGAGAYGKVALAATTATLIPASASTIGGTQVLIQNLGTGDIYCGTDANVLTTTGIKIAAGSSATIGSGKPTLVRTNIYCYAASAQTSPADTRWLEVR